jgi:hypothetical protein
MNNPYNYLDKYLNQELTYKEFCKITNLPYLNGKAKVLQLNKVRQYVYLEQINRKIIIKDIRTEEEIEQYNNKKYYNTLNKISNKKDYNNFLVNYKDADKSGIYKIQLNNIIYIGQTVKFKERYKHHYLSNEQTSKLLKNGAIFEILELEDDKDLRLQKEQEYIKQYCEDDNYICINYIGTVNQVKNIKKYCNLRFSISDKDRMIKLLEENNIDYKEI